MYHVAGKAAQHSLAPAAVGIGAHHQQIRLFLPDFLIQPCSDIFIVLHLHLHTRRLDAVEAESQRLDGRNLDGLDIDALTSLAERLGAATARVVLTAINPRGNL